MINKLFAAMLPALALIPSGCSKDCDQGRRCPLRNPAIKGACGNVQHVQLPARAVPVMPEPVQGSDPALPSGHNVNFT